KRHGQRLVLSEHERRQLEATLQPVPPVAATFARYRDAQVLQHGHVTAHGALIDFQPLRELCTSDPAARLEQLQDGQQPGGWVVQIRTDLIRNRCYGVCVMYGFGDPELIMELARQRMRELHESARHVSRRGAEAEIVHAVFDDEERVRQRPGEWSRRVDG